MKLYGLTKQTGKMLLNLFYSNNGYVIRLFYENKIKIRSIRYSFINRIQKQRREFLNYIFAILNFYYLNLLTVYTNKSVEYC